MNCRVWEIVQGDQLPVFVADARTAAGPFDFTGWALTFTIAGPVTRTGAATGDALGVMTYVWAPGDTDIQGDYEARFTGISPEGKRETFRVEGVVRIVAP